MTGLLERRRGALALAGVAGVVAIWVLAGAAAAPAPTGSSPLVGVTTRVSVGSTSAQGNDESFEAVVSADGRYVAFTSFASNLVPGDTNDTYDVFVLDRVADVTRRVSVSSTSAQGNDESFEPAVSADGRYVAFTSFASNLVPGDTNETLDVFVRDLTAETTQRVSVGPGGRQANNFSQSAAISAHGRYVAFHSPASNLVAGDTNNGGDVFVRDLTAGTTQRVSVGPDGRQANGTSSVSVVSAPGRHVAFTSDASNLVAGDSNHASDAFVRKVMFGETRRVSVGHRGRQGNGDSFVSDIFGHGRYVAFSSRASNLVPGDTNHTYDAFVWTRPLR